MLKFIFGLFAAFFFSSSFSQGIFPATSSANSITFGPGSLNKSNSLLTDLLNRPLSSPSVSVSSPGKIPLPDGPLKDIIVRGRANPVSVASALGNFAKKSVPFLAVGSALYDLAIELGFVVIDGVLHKEESVCLTPCFGFKVANDFFGPTAQSASTAWAVAIHGGASSATSCETRESFSPPGVVRCNLILPSGGFGGYIWAEPVSSEPTEELVPASIPEFQSAISSRPSFPSGSSILRAVELFVESGETIEIIPESISGPASTPGPVSVTNKSDGTTTTTSVQHNHNYQGPTVSTTTVTTTVVTNTTTGVEIDRSETTVTPQLPPPTATPPEPGPATDTPFPAIPKLYEPSFPDGLSGVWEGKKSEFEQTSLFTVLPSLLPNLGDSNGCPAWSLPSYYGGTLDASIPCGVWTFLRLVILITALLLARRLIFGG